jgi:hypothetical protein
MRPWLLGSAIAVVVIAGVALGAKKLSDSRNNHAAAASHNTAKTTTTFALTDATYRRGDCVTWDQKAGNTERDTTVVPCSQLHLLEIAGSINLQPRFDHFPSQAELHVVYSTLCAQQIGELMGRPLDPYGRFGAGGIEPLENSWLNGDRILWCGAAASEPQSMFNARRFTPFRGRVEAADQTRLDAIGSCFAGEAAPRLTKCLTPHTFEITGYAHLADGTTLPASDDTAGWDRLVGTTCQQMGTQYLGHAPTGDVQTGWVAIEQASWDAGRRVAECTVGRYRGDTPILTNGPLRA